MVEAKCVHLGKSQSQADSQEKGPVPTDHWRVLIALHRTLLHEHQDFFLASQNSSESPALQSLAAEYNLTARMWKHGIRSFLELLRHLPASPEFMVPFIYVAYQMMSLLYETVPTVRKTWIECLGDLSRYRMAVEEDSRDREVWARVATFWYSEVANLKLKLSSQALTCTQSVPGASESIQPLFDTILQYSSSDVNLSFMKGYAKFPYRSFESQEPSLNEANGFKLDREAKFKWISINDGL
jgi:hypothetical protein